MRNLVALVAGAGLALVVAAAKPAAAQDGDYLAFSLGAFDFVNETTTEARIEYRSGRKKFNIGPKLGVLFTSKASLYVYGGFYLDLSFGRWVVMPSLAVGAYYEGNGKDLGHVIEFHSGVEVSYRFDDRSRLGIALHHISNANIGDRNPGAESLVVTYAIPFDLL